MRQDRRGLHERSIWNRCCGLGAVDSRFHEGVWLDLTMIHDPCVVLKPEMLQIAKTARVDSFCKLEGGLGITLGEFVHIGSFSHINVGGGRVVFEDHSGCSTHCCIGSGTPDWSYLYISAAEPLEHHHTIRTLTRICAYAVLFMGSMVVPGVTIGEGAIVKSGSVVYEDVPPWYIVQGNPAVRVGYRKITDEDNRRVLLPKRHRIPGAILRANGRPEERVRESE